jgi:hypothetical protein
MDQFMCNHGQKIDLAVRWIPRSGRETFACVGASACRARPNPSAAGDISVGRSFRSVSSEGDSNSRLRVGELDARGGLRPLSRRPFVI